MNDNTNQRVRDICDQILANENPLIPFGTTYAVHDELNARGVFYCGTGGRYCIVANLRYRVDHGSHVTQNTWGYLDRACRMKEI
jgi:hypothetical protein